MRKLDASLCEVCCLVLSRLTDCYRTQPTDASVASTLSAMDDVAGQLDGGAADSSELLAGRGDVAARQPAVPGSAGYARQLSDAHGELASRLCLHLRCRLMTAAATTADGAPGGAASDVDEEWRAGTGARHEMRALLCSCRLLGGCAWIDADALLHLQDALVHAWEVWPIEHPSRTELLEILIAGVVDAAVPSRTRPSDGGGGGGHGGCGDGGAGAVSAVGLPSDVRVRFLKSLPKTLWMAAARLPRLSDTILSALLSLGRTGDALEALQPALVPFFCARPRGKLAGQFSETSGPSAPSPTPDPTPRPRCGADPRPVCIPAALLPPLGAPRALSL